MPPLLPTRLGVDTKVTRLKPVSRRARAPPPEWPRKLTVRPAARLKLVAVKVDMLPGAGTEAYPDWMVAWPGPIMIGPARMVVVSGACVPVAALAMKLNVPALSVMGAVKPVRAGRLTLVVFALPLLSRSNVAPGLATNPLELIAVPAASRASVPALTIVLPV